MEKIKKLECYLCEKDKFLLIGVDVASDSYFPAGKGVCTECFKEGNIDEKIFLKHKNFIKENIGIAKEREEYWQGELKKLINKET